MSGSSDDVNGDDDAATQPDMGDLFDELEALEESVDSEEERERVRETMRTAASVQDDVVFGRVIYGFGRDDLAEAFLGSLLFGFPMFVEQGTIEIGEYVAQHPIFLALTLGLAVGLAISILYVADIQDVRIHNPFFGILPRRLVGVLVVSLATALVMMTVWGRVDWATPWLAFCQCAVAFVPMTIGAALGDILPGT